MLVTHAIMTSVEAARPALFRNRRVREHRRIRALYHKLTVQCLPSRTRRAARGCVLGPRWELGSVSVRTRLGHRPGQGRAVGLQSARGPGMAAQEPLSVRGGMCRHPLVVGSSWAPLWHSYCRPRGRHGDVAGSYGHAQSSGGTGRFQNAGDCTLARSVPVTSPSRLTSARGSAAADKSRFQFAGP